MFLITGTHLHSSNVHKMSEQYISMTQNLKEEDKILSVILVTKILQERGLHFHSFTTRRLSWWTYNKFTMHRIAQRSQSLGMKCEKVCWHRCHSVARISVIWHPLRQGRAFPRPSGWSPPAQRPQLQPWKRNATECCYMTGNEGSYQIWLWWIPSSDCKNQFNKPKMLHLGRKKRDSANVNNSQIKTPI